MTLSNTLSAPRGLSKGNPMKRLATSFLTAACLAAPLALLAGPAAQAQSVSRPANDINLSIGRGQLITVGGAMADVAGGKTPIVKHRFFHVPASNTAVGHLILENN